MSDLKNSWDKLLEPQWQSDYMGKLREFLRAQYRTHTVYPPKSEMLAAFENTAYEDVKVVILGQDPYHGAGQANGLCFSVGEGVKCPPSLVNIYKALEYDLGIKPTENGDLRGWAKQGVLLLNATLTVRAGQSDAHSTCGWQTFTDSIIKKLGSREKPMVFILWGAKAQKKRAYIAPHHCVIASAHPSPLSAYNGFFGSRPFSRANAFLEKNGMKPIDWTDVGAYDKPEYYSGKGRIERG